MKILFTTSYFLPYVSGLTVYVDRISRQLSQRGHLVTILTTQHRRDLPSQERVDGLGVKRVPFLFSVSKGFFMPSYLWVCWQVVADNDVVLVNLPQLEGVIPAIYGRLQGKKVYCIYNCEVFLPKSLFNWTVERLLLLATSFTVSLADKIIVYTTDYANHSRVLPYFKSKWVPIYPPVPPLATDRRQVSLLRKRLPERRKYIIGVAARLSVEKGLEYLLEAIPELTRGLGEDLLIVFAGPKDPVGEEAYSRHLAPLVEKHRSYLAFLGSLQQEEMGSFYDLLDVLVLPSVNSTEAFGMVQVEAMMRGVPVVATNLPGVRVPVQKTGMGEIVPPKNSSALAKATTNVLLNKEAYLKGQNLVQQEFSLAVTVKAYEKLLGSIS